LVSYGGVNGRRRGIIWGTLVILLLAGGFVAGRRLLWSDPAPDPAPDGGVVAGCSHEPDPRAEAFVRSSRHDPGEMTLEMHLRMNSAGLGPGYFTWGPSIDPGLVLRQGGTEGEVTVTVAAAGTVRVLRFCDGEWVRSIALARDRETALELRDPTGGARIEGAKATLRARR
jgi:hypothetical protein